jgi:hypothetical protein
MTDHAHLLSIANSRLEQIRGLEAELDAWRGVAAQLAAALENTKPRPTSHPAVFLTHAPERTAALESYARLKTGFNSYEL